LLLTAGIIVGASGLALADMTQENVRLALNANAASGPPVYAVFEANVADEAAYTKALPDVRKMIKENGGEPIAGGFNRTKLVMGKPTRQPHVILRWESEEAFTKAHTGGVKAWIEKNAPEAREIMVQSFE
jgi:hypothetical protein